VRELTNEKWIAEAKQRFGDNSLAWRFVCPSCGHVASVQDWKEAGAPNGAVAFSCIGRYVGDGKAAADNAFKHKGGPCNYTGGGLFRLNPVVVLFDDGEKMEAFEFADAVGAPEAGEQPAEEAGHVA
jgi:hypothetical protein